MATTHDKAIYLRVTEQDLRRLDDLAERYPILKRSSLARAAMRMGLDAIERDPTVLLKQPVPKRGGVRRKRK